MSRNGSGTYTLPSGNPVVSGTLIEASWANTTLDDLASAMTDSLSRTGQGGMQAALRLYDGTSSVPGLAWGSETTTGWYRAGAGDMRLVITGSQVIKYLATGVDITGTLSVSGNTTLSGGTANGVAYLNGSKVLTTGSALTFDGTKYQLGVSGSTGATLASTFAIEDYSSTDQFRLTMNWAGSGKLGIGASGTSGMIFGTASSAAGGVSSEWMRLTSTGLGIGTSSPSEKLTVAGRIMATVSGYTVNPTGSIFGYYNATAPVTYIQAPASGSIEFWGPDTSAWMRLVSGNLGLGVMPSAWGSTYRALQIGLAGSLSGISNDTQTNLSNNARFDGTNWLYLANSPASRYAQIDNSHRWFIAPSGTAGNAISFTQAMTLDASSFLTVVGGATIQGLTVGRGAGAVSTNTAVGASALAANTSGDNNVAVGYYSANSNTTGAFITALGRNALVLNTTGSYNVGVGSYALQNNTTASNNTAVGYQAGYANTTGASNTIIGYQAGASNTTGGQNTFIGNSAGNANTTANGVTYIGNLVGRIATGGDNVGVGGGWTGSIAPTLYSLTTGQFNTAVGSGAMGYTTTANSNVAMGYLAACYNTTGAQNTALGTNALYNNTTASENTAVGYQAGYSATTGYRNVLLGKGAGYTNNSSYNVMIGYNAGANTSGLSNTFVGANYAYGTGAGSEVTSGAKNTIIGGFTGNQGGLDIRTASNYIVLSDGDGNPRGYSNASGIWNFGGGIKCAQLTLSNGTTGTITVPNGCVCTMSGDGYFDDGLMFTLKSQGGSQGCYVMARGGSAGSWGIGTTSNPASGSRGNLWISATNTLSIQNLAGSTITFYFTFLSAS